MVHSAQNSIPHLPKCTWFWWELLTTGAPPLFHTPTPATVISPGWLTWCRPGKLDPFPRIFKHELRRESPLLPGQKVSRRMCVQNWSLISFSTTPDLSTYNVEKNGEMRLHTGKSWEVEEREGKRQSFWQLCLWLPVFFAGLHRYLVSWDSKSLILFKLPWVRFLSAAPVTVLTNISYTEGLNQSPRRYSPRLSQATVVTALCLWSRGQGSHIRHTAGVHPALLWALGVWKAGAWPGHWPWALLHPCTISYNCFLIYASFLGMVLMNGRFERFSTSHLLTCPQVIQERNGVLFSSDWTPATFYFQ